MRPTSERGELQPRGTKSLPDAQQRPPPFPKLGLRPLQLHGNGSSRTNQRSRSPPSQAASAPTRSHGCLKRVRLSPHPSPSVRLRLPPGPAAPAAARVPQGPARAVLASLGSGTEHLSQISLRATGRGWQALVAGSGLKPRRWARCPPSDPSQRAGRPMWPWLPYWTKGSSTGQSRAQATRLRGLPSADVLC